MRVWEFMLAMLFAAIGFVFGRSAGDSAAGVRCVQQCECPMKETAP